MRRIVILGGTGFFGRLIGEQLSAADSLAFFEPYLHELPIDATPHRHGIERNDRPESVQIDADVARFRSCGHDRHGPPCLGVLSLTGGTRLRLVGLGQQGVPTDGKDTGHEKPEYPTLEQLGKTNRLWHLVFPRFLGERRHHRPTKRALHQPATFLLRPFQSVLGGLQVVARDLPTSLEFGVELIQLSLLFRRQLGLDLGHPLGQSLFDLRLMQEAQL